MDNSDEDEEYPTEEEEMIAAIEQGKCHVCSNPLLNCEHLLLLSDETFGSIEGGSLKSLIIEIRDYFDEIGEDQNLVMDELKMSSYGWITYENDSSANPMSASSELYIWGDTKKSERIMRDMFLPNKG